MIEFQLEKTIMVNFEGKEFQGKIIAVNTNQKRDMNSYHVTVRINEQKNLSAPMKDFIKNETVQSGPR